MRADDYEAGFQAGVEQSKRDLGMALAIVDMVNKSPSGSELRTMFSDRFVLEVCGVADPDRPPAWLKTIEGEAAS